MELAVLESELESLSPDQQNRVAAFLAALRMRREGLMEEFTRRIDDSNPSGWVSWEDGKAELELGSD